MQIFTQEILDKLMANGRATLDAQDSGRTEPDHVPVVKVFNPFGSGTWLFTECDPDEPDRLFGLCHIFEPELGYASRSEIEGVRVMGGLSLERDLYFRPEHPLSVYARAAKDEDYITEDRAALERAANGK